MQKILNDPKCPEDIYAIHVPKIEDTPFAKFVPWIDKEYHKTVSLRAEAGIDEKKELPAEKKQQHNLRRDLGQSSVLDRKIMQAEEQLNAKVLGDAEVSGDAEVRGNAKIYDSIIEKGTVIDGNMVKEAPVSVLAQKIRQAEKQLADINQKDGKENALESQEKVGEELTV